MYCGACQSYIPSGLNIAQCPNCGLAVEEAQKIAEANAGRQKLAEEKNRRELQKSLKKYGYFEALYCSFFSRYFYLDVIRRWKGIGGFYAVFLIGLGLIPFALALDHALIKIIDKTVLPAVRQMPTISIAGGDVSLNKPSPYVIRSPEDGSIVAILDTTGNYTDLTTIPATVLVSKNQLAFKEPSGAVRVVRISPAIHFILTPDLSAYAIEQFVHWLPFMIFPVLWFAYVVMLFCFAAVYALFAKGLAALLKCGRPYGDLFRLSVVGFTPMVLLDAALSWPDPDAGLPDPLVYLIPAVTIALALWFYKTSSRTQTA